MWRSFCPRRTGESRLTRDSPDLASIISVRSKNGSLQRLNALWAAFAQPSPLQETESFFNRSGLSIRERPHQTDAAETRTLLTNGSRFTLLAGLGRSARGGSDGGRARLIRAPRGPAGDRGAGSGRSYATRVFFLVLFLFPKKFARTA
jgi:hypothetical protein